MNPWTVIEHVPASWDKIDVSIYHAYGKRFAMENKLTIKLTPMSKINEKDCFADTIYETSWPLEGW